MDNYSFVLYSVIILIGLSNTQFVYEQGRINNTLRNRRQSSFKCTIPHHPLNGRWMNIDGVQKPGDQIEAFTIVRLDCKPGYRLIPNYYRILCDDNWNPSRFPKCEKKCPAFYTTVTTEISCVDRHGHAISCDQAIDGTFLFIKCKDYYEVPTGYKNGLYCNEGTWDFPKPVCQPICGYNPATAPFASGGVDVEENEFPWVVAVYKRMGEYFQNVCGGTLVSRRVVITAAHCVTNNYGSPLTQTDFRIAAGKRYNAINDPRDWFAQIRELSKLIVHDGFRGESQRFVADIAILVTKQLFKLGRFVQPICINNVNDIDLMNNQLGKVAGWGLTLNNVPADILQVIKIPFKERATCTKELPSEWEEKYNFLDKICAGHFKQNISVCVGDSGSGLVFKNRADLRYYIHGLVSLAPKSSALKCNFETNALYTSISFYYDFVVGEMTKNYVEDCELPQHPRNGRWQLENDEEKKPKDIVPSTTILKFSCDRGYILSSRCSYYECEDTYHTPTCNLPCPQLQFPKNTTVTCKNSRSETINCGLDKWFSTTFTCPDGFESYLGGRTSTRYCTGGYDEHPIPSCLRKSVKPKTATHVSIPSDGLKVICTYISWWGYDYNGVFPEDLDPTLCTHIVYQFIGLWDTGDVRIQEREERDIYNSVVELKKRNPDLKVMWSVGGTEATNSSIFRSVASDANKTGAFLRSVDNLLKTYNFDGINIHWLYPEVDDEEIYIRFLDKVKEEFNKNGWLLSASVRPDFYKTGYNPKEMNRILDWVTIETVNFYDSWSQYTGNHNEMIASSIGNEWEKRHLNVDAGGKNWLKAGLTKEKMVLSVAFYGRSFTLKDKNERGTHTNITGSSPGFDIGILSYYEICSEYVYGFNEIWDDETKTAYKYNETVWIGFNSEEAVRINGEYIKKNGYAGVNVFPINGDDNKGICGQQHVLLKHLHVGMEHPVLLENWV